VKILFVVHRYAPFPGGSENFVAAMAREALSRGHDVHVLAHKHLGDQEGIHVTGDLRILRDRFDLMVVHGSNRQLQSEVLERAREWRSPVLFHLIMPRSHPHCLIGCDRADFIGWSTTRDLEFLRERGFLHKAVRVRHGIDPVRSVPPETPFKERHGIGSRLMFLSAGGFWKRKGMVRLAELFRAARIPDASLVCTGYTEINEHAPRPCETVYTLVLKEHGEVLAALREADLLIMNSTREGFGIILLEAMLNRTPWAARDVGGAPDLAAHGVVYRTDDELLDTLSNFSPVPGSLDAAYEFVTRYHLVSNTLDDIEGVLSG
jgi:glycosyltransferase involved in cell wall biosynthesis